MKYIAALFMLFDHIGMILYPHNTQLRIIGRLAMPIFAYGIAMGFMHTSSLKKYSLRLLIFTIVSQPVFAVMQYNVYGEVRGTNIGVTFLLGIICLAAINNRITLTKGNKIANMLIVSLALIMTNILQSDYGVYGVITIIVFYKSIVTKQDAVAYWGMGIVTCCYAIFYKNLLQIFSIFTLLFIPYLENNDLKRNNLKMPRYFLYVFYPFHILIILAIELIFYN